MIISEYFMVEKICWNENGPRVTGRRPFVCETKRSVRKADKGPLGDESFIPVANVFM